MPTDAEVQAFVDDLVQECMDDPVDQLSCAIEMIQTIPDELEVCRPEFLLLTQKDCPNCPPAREKYATLLEQGIAREVTAESEEGKRVMEANNLDSVPSLLLVTCEGKLIGEFVDSHEVEGEDIG